MMSLAQKAPSVRSIHSWWSDRNTIGPTVSLHAAAKPLVAFMYHRQARRLILGRGSGALMATEMNILATYLSFKYTSSDTKIMVLDTITADLAAHGDADLIISENLVVSGLLLALLDAVLQRNSEGHRVHFAACRVTAQLVANAPEGLGEEFRIFRDLGPATMLSRDAMNIISDMHSFLRGCLHDSVGHHLLLNLIGHAHHPEVLHWIFRHIISTVGPEYSGTTRNFFQTVQLQINWDHLEFSSWSISPMVESDMLKLFMGLAHIKLESCLCDAFSSIIRMDSAQKHSCKVVSLFSTCLWIVYICRYGDAPQGSDDNNNMYSWTAKALPKVINYLQLNDEFDPNTIRDSLLKHILVDVRFLSYLRHCRARERLGPSARETYLTIIRSNEFYTRHEEDIELQLEIAKAEHIAESDVETWEVRAWADTLTRAMVAHQNASVSRVI
uniref:Uncharacterized protein n=1 Tax=Mycena chlorophos TaxID=658473 RepID=A0ABQ0L5X9_MYCCL|nr:predicted protein [Mycena chlorophos]